MANNTLKPAMPDTFPPRHQEHVPGKEREMMPRPVVKGIRFHYGTGIAPEWRNAVA